MNKFVLAFLGLCLAGTSHITASGQTLRDAVQYAMTSNPEVLATANRRFAADQGLRQARAGYLPRIDLSLGKGREQLDSPGTRLQRTDDSSFFRHERAVTLSQMLFDGFAVRSQVDQQQARIASTAYGFAATADDVALRLVAVYLEVLRRHATVAAARDNLAAHERIFEQIRIRTESGVGRRADFEQAEGRLALANASLRGEESSLRNAELGFLRVVGENPRALELPQIEPDSIPSAEQLALEYALANHPAVKAAQANIDAAIALRSTAQAALYPRLDLELSANRNRDALQGEVDDKRIMLRLRYNLFSGGINSARVQETAFQIEEAREEMNRIRREVGEALAAAFNTNRTARDRLIALQQYVDSSARAREAYAIQFSIGQRTLLDLLNAENEFFNARLSYLDGQYAEFTSIYQIHAGMGQLLQKLGIMLPPDIVSIRYVSRP